PFLALAGVAALPLRAASGVLVAHALLSSPWALDAYAPNAWKLSGFPWRAAVRIETESDYLQRVSWDYRVAKMVERNTKANERIFDLVALHAAYIDRPLIGYYQSALGDRLLAGLVIANSPSGAPFYQLTAQFPEQ